MQVPNWRDFLQCSVCANKYNASQVVPISLSCGHTLCRKCLTKLKTRACPYDKTSMSPNVEALPPNNALLQLLGQKIDESNADLSQLNLSEGDCEQFKESQSSIEELALFLQPLAEQGITAAVSHLTSPMLKELVTVVNCQVLESEGRARALRAARSIADQTVTELLVMHQNQQQISTLLWTAVRNRGCQFLGPVMQEEALKLILKVLENGKFLSRKAVVLYVVEQLQQDFPQASKTCVGHVVQLLHRASCFNVEKREDDSSLMQLKEEFRSYESLRREHDAKIVHIAMEAGLRISPEQWSALLYGNHKHKSDMQSIIDKLIVQGAASSGLNELIVAISRSQDPYNLSEKLIPHLEVLLKIDINIDKSSELVSSWQMFTLSMKALLATLQGFSTFLQIQSGCYKTGMCSNLGKVGGCPKGDNCIYAHSEEERERFRSIFKSNKPRQLSRVPWPVKLDTSHFSSLSRDGYSTSSHDPGSSSHSHDSGYSSHSCHSGSSSHSRDSGYSSHSRHSGSSSHSYDSGYPSHSCDSGYSSHDSGPITPFHSFLPILQTSGEQFHLNYSTPFSAVGSSDPYLVETYMLQMEDAHSTGSFVHNSPHYYPSDPTACIYMDGAKPQPPIAIRQVRQVSQHMGYDWQSFCHSYEMIVGGFPQGSTPPSLPPPLCDVVTEPGRPQYISLPASIEQPHATELLELQRLRIVSPESEAEQEIVNQSQLIQASQMTIADKVEAAVKTGDAEVCMVAKTIEDELLACSQGQKLSQKGISQPSVPYMDSVETVICDSTGGVFYSPIHDLGFAIPKGAIPEGDSINVEVGVTLTGPFDFPQGSKPVSPIVKLCVQQQPNYQFLKPVEVVLPHYLDLTSEEGNSELQIGFWKAGHTLNDNQLYKFQQIDLSNTHFKHEYGTLQTNHFCFLCIGEASGVTNEITAKASFYLLGYQIMLNPTEWRVYFCVAYFLATCVEAVRRQFPVSEGYSEMFKKRFKFTNQPTSERKIEIKFERGLSEEWMLALESTDKTKATDVDFWSIDAIELELMHKERIYPPRFQIHAYATRCMCTPIFFQGTAEDITVELLLKPANSVNHTAASRVISMESEPELCDLMNKVAVKIPEKLWHIGLQLGMTVGELNAWTRECGGNTCQCFSVIFDSWKKRTRTCSWSAIITALEAPLVGEPRLAKELKAILNNQPHESLLAHVQRKGEYQRIPFPLNLTREDTRLLGKHPYSEEIDMASFPSSPPHKRNGLE